jgi:hypothetical protein
LFRKFFEIKWIQSELHPNGIQVCLHCRAEYVHEIPFKGIRALLSIDFHAFAIGNLSTNQYGDLG